MSVTLGNAALKKLMIASAFGNCPVCNLECRRMVAGLVEKPFTLIDADTCATCDDIAGFSLGR